MKFPRVRPAVAAWAAIIVSVSAVSAQQHGPLSNKDAFGLYERSVQLMQSTSLAMPDLAKAGAPIVENARAALATLRSLNSQHAGVTYQFLTNVRAFLLLADTLPKPDTLPEEATRQFAELRTLADRTDVNLRSLLDEKESRLRNPDRDNLARYADADAKLGPPRPGSPRIVFLGDSITDGWRLNEYFPDRDFVNRGISGQITGEMLGRMQADVIRLKPEAVLILAGTNDIGRGVAVQAVEDNLAMIASLAEFYGIKPMIASILPVSDYHKDQDPNYEMSRTHPLATIRNVNDWIRSFCAQHNYIYVDYYAATVDAKGFFRTELSDDGLHPNPAGYRAMAPVALAAIEKSAAKSGGAKHHGLLGRH